MAALPSRRSPPKTTLCSRFCTTQRGEKTTHRCSEIIRPALNLSLAHCVQQTSMDHMKQGNAPMITSNLTRLAVFAAGLAIAAAGAAGAHTTDTASWVTDHPTDPAGVLTLSAIELNGDAAEQRLTPLLQLARTGTTTKRRPRITVRKIKRKTNTRKLRVRVTSTTKHNWKKSTWMAYQHQLNLTGGQNTAVPPTDCPPQPYQVCRDSWDGLRYPWPNPN